MTSQTKQPQSIFPDLPRESPTINNSGDFSSQWSLAFSQLFQGLQANFKNEGIQFPQLTDSEITTIQGLYTPFIGSPLPTNPPLPDISGQTIFDSTNRVPKIFVITYDGATPPNVVTAQWKTFTLV